MPRLNVLLRIGLLAALVAGLAAVPSSAALPGSGKIAFAWTSGVFTVDPDGGGRARISDYASNVVWSPDGSKLALVRQDFAGGHLFVADADGTNEHHIYDSTYTGTFVSDQPWSPDGARIVFAGPGGVHTASAEGDDVRTVTTDTVSSPVVWSPMGSLLAYSVQNNLVVSAPDGTGRTQIAANARYPEWSPDGIHLAFGHYVPSDDWGIYVARPDGTELHKVVATESAPTWSPDGSRIGFTSRLGYVGRNPATDAFTVGADGSGLRRLTRTNTGSRPTWSPDGARVLILAGTALRSINPDGTCEYQIDPAVNSWSWRPVPGRRSASANARRSRCAPSCFARRLSTCSSPMRARTRSPQPTSSYRCRTD